MSSYSRNGRKSALVFSVLTFILCSIANTANAEVGNPNSKYMGYVDSDQSLEPEDREYYYQFRDESFGTRVGLRDEDDQVIATSNLSTSTWYMHEFPRTVCLNNTNASLLANDSPNVEGSKKLLIYFQGGNACFDPNSCPLAHWKNGYGIAEFAHHLSSNLGDEPQRDGSLRHTYEGMGAYNRGIFNRKQENNPFKDYNYVTIPYCSGDAYMGSAGTEDGFTDDDITHINGRDEFFNSYNHKHIFRGYYNVKEFTKWIVENYPEMEEVVVMGQSAGAIGATYHFNAIYQSFKARAEADERDNEIKFSLIDDSGFSLLDKDVNNCAQAGIRYKWHMNNGLNESVVRDNMNDEWVYSSDTGEFMDLLVQQNFKLPVDISYIRSEGDVALYNFFKYAAKIGKSEAGCDDTGVKWFSSKNRYPSGLLGTRSVTKNFHHYLVNLPSHTEAAVKSWIVPSKRHQWVLGPDAGQPAVEAWKIDMPWEDWTGEMPDSTYYYPNNPNGITLNDWITDMLDPESTTDYWDHYRIPRQLCQENNDLGDKFYKTPGITPPFPDDGKFMMMCDGA